jgi:hypothetical protein
LSVPARFAGPVAGGGIGSGREPPGRVEWVAGRVPPHAELARALCMSSAVALTRRTLNRVVSTLTHVGGLVVVGVDHVHPQRVVHFVWHMYIVLCAQSHGKRKGARPPFGRAKLSVQHSS